VLVETRAAARAAVRQIIRARCRHPGAIGLDIETAPLPRYQRERPPVRLNKDGSLSKQQPKHDDPAGLSPHTAAIATLQLYAGDDRCFIFRGEALALLLTSHWMRSQHFVVHNATFDTAFLRHYTSPSKPLPQRRRRGRIECSMQATGLLQGTGAGGGGRSLAAAAQAFLGLGVAKDVRSSDWGAAHLSRGQVAYAARDAVLAHRLWPLLDEQMTAKGREGAYALQRGAVLPVADMELRGVLLDCDRHKAKAGEWSRELAEARHRYHEMTGKPPPSKPNEIREWLTDVLEPAQLGSWPRTESGDQLAVSAKHLERLAHIPSARPVLDILAREKLLSNFGAGLAALINPATGRLHAHYSIAGVKSGRFTCSNPNLQQLPARRAPPQSARRKALSKSALAGLSRRRGNLVVKYRTRKPAIS
jgi:DNA polymerase I-like protein with 3'-5' exonuclease and polymerase domains